MNDYKKGIRSELSKPQPNWGFIEELSSRAEREHRDYNRHCLNIELIVCNIYKISYKQLHGEDRTNASVWARYFMFEYRKEYGESLKSIAYSYNIKRYSTVFTGLKTHLNLLKDSEYSELNKKASSAVIEYHKLI